MIRGFETTNYSKENLKVYRHPKQQQYLKKDINGNITTDINTAVITPRAPAAGYLAPEITSFEGSGPGTGNISITILNPDSIKHINTYRLNFR